MNRAERRAHAKRMREYPKKLTPVDPRDWPGDDGAARTGVWRSRDYLVQEFQEDNGLVRLTVCRTAVRGDGRWADGLTWEELQRIKNAVGYDEADAVEIYPRARDEVNVANMRHLWILPGMIEFAWRRG